MRLTYLGHSAVQLETSGGTVLIDPFLTGNPRAGASADAVAADLIVLTHAHGDHWGDTEAIAKRTGATVVGSAELAGYASGLGLKAHGMNVGGKHEFPQGTVRYTPALHSNSLPDGTYAGMPMGVVIEADGVRVYHAGDTAYFSDMARIGARRAGVAADAAALRRVAAARVVVEEAMASHQPVYGSTTGVGAMKDVEWTADQLDAFNLGLVRAHHFGTGDAFSNEIVRVAMAIRVNMALTGRVGCTTDLVEAYLALLSANVVPVVRRTGSIGCADIGLMGQIGAVLTGTGEAMFNGQRQPAADALAAAGLKPFRLAPRDSLASVSTNAVGYAAAAHAIRQAAGTVRVMLATGLTTAGALGASRDPWKAVAHVGTEREAGIGAWLYFNAKGWDWPDATHIQDPLSLRMLSQVFATGFETLVAAGKTLLAATGRTDDNPVVAGEKVLTSGGSLPLDVTVFLQTAQLGLAHIARNSFNRCVLLGNGQRRDLPVNLVPPGAIATGFGPIIKLAGEMFARVLSLTNPISANSMVVALREASSTRGKGAARARSERAPPASTSSPRRGR